MRFEKTTLLFALLFGLAAALTAAPGFAADAFDTDARQGSMEDAAKQPADETYVVEEGDTLAEIAKERLGSADKWKEIARANDIDDPDALRVGQKLSIPSKRSEDPQRSKL